MTESTMLAIEIKRADELKVGDRVGHYDELTADWDRDEDRNHADPRTVFHIETYERNLFGVVDLHIMVGVTQHPDLADDHELRQQDIYVGCLPDTGWEVQS